MPVSPPPDASVIIVTRNREDALREAVASALGQSANLEVLVIDDGSTDGTAAMIREAFPEVRLERRDASAGLVVRRNEAARLARGPVIVSLDDDAVFTTPDVVAQTLADFDDPRVGAVAIPYVDVLLDPAECQRAPTPHGVWVLATFRGTAHALLREPFLALGGYRELIFHQGEEVDLSLRMLEAGSVVRAGRADPVHHFASAQRSLERMDRYGRRNELLLCWTYLPRPWHVVLMAGFAVRGLLFGLRVRRPAAMLRGIGAGLAVSWRHRHERRPVSPAVFRLDRRLRRAGVLPLSEIARELPQPPSSA